MKTASDSAEAESLLYFLSRKEKKKYNILSLDSVM